jgi:GT2 family glycosyltransferase
LGTVGVLVATYGRPAELDALLNCLTLQSEPVAIAVVVDSSEDAISKINQRICGGSYGFPVKYIKCDIPSSTVQRNIGATFLLNSGVDLIQILDDDTQPASNYISKLKSVIASKPNAVGASGVTMPAPAELNMLGRLKKALFVLVGLESLSPGTVSLAGCGIPVSRKNRGVQRTEWLFGCSLWKASVFQSQQFNPRLRGAALAEDLHFSMLAARNGTLWVDATAELWHSYSQVERPDESLYAYRFARNRWFVIVDKTNYRVSTMFYVASNLTLAAITLLRGIVSADKVLYVASGNYVIGMLHAWQGRQPR